MFARGLKAAAPSVQAGGKLAEVKAAPGFPGGLTPVGDGPW